MAERTLGLKQLLAGAHARARLVAGTTVPRFVVFALAIAAYRSIEASPVSSPLQVSLLAIAALLTIATGAMWSADMYRRMVAEAGAGAIWKDGFRLALANLAVYLFFFILCFLLMLAFVLLTGILIGVSGFDPQQAGIDADDISQSLRALSSIGGIAVIYGLLALAGGVLLWIGMRLVLYGAATVAERHVTVFRSWAWTKGHGVKLALAWIVLQGVPLLLLTMASDGVMISLGLPSGPLGDIVRNQAPRLDLPWAHAVAGVVWVTFTVPVYWLGHGLAATSYTALAPNTVDPDATFA